MTEKHPFQNWVECPECYEEQPDDNYCDFCGANLHPDGENEWTPNKYYRQDAYSPISMGLRPIS